VGYPGQAMFFLQGLLVGLAVAWAPGLVLMSYLVWRTSRELLRQNKFNTHQPIRPSQSAWANPAAATYTMTPSGIRPSCSAWFCAPIENANSNSPRSSDVHENPFSRANAKETFIAMDAP
jgi:hypothetical protein